MDRETFKAFLTLLPDEELAWYRKATDVEYNRRTNRLVPEEKFQIWIEHLRKVQEDRDKEKLEIEKLYSKFTYFS